MVGTVSVVDGVLVVAGGGRGGGGSGGGAGGGEGGGSGGGGGGVGVVGSKGEATNEIPRNGR